MGCTIAVDDRCAVVRRMEPRHRFRSGTCRRQSSALSDAATEAQRAVLGLRKATTDRVPRNVYLRSEIAGYKVPRKR